METGAGSGAAVANVPEGWSWDGALDEDRKPHGQGTLTAADGTTQEGSFQHGVLHGKGKITRANGIIFDGPFVKGKLHGQGVRVNPKSAKAVRLEGNFTHGEPDGKMLQFPSRSLAMYIVSVIVVSDILENYVGVFLNTKHNFH